MRKMTGAAKAPSMGKVNFQMKIRLTRHRPQAKLVANSYWLVNGSRPAPMPRQISAAVCSTRPTVCKMAAALATPSFLTAMKTK